MIKTTIAVMASLMLASCGINEEPKGGTPEEPKVENVVDVNAGTNKAGTNKTDTIKPKTPLADEVAKVADVADVATKDLTLTYFNLGG